MSFSGQDAAKKGEVVWFELSGSLGGSIEIEASGKERARLLLYAAEPIDEPIVFGGPFVMNTQEEIDQAFADLESGKLVVV